MKQFLIIVLLFLATSIFAKADLKESAFNKLTEKTSSIVSNLIPGEGLTEVDISQSENLDNNFQINVLGLSDILTGENSNFFTQFSLHNQEINNDDSLIKYDMNCVKNILQDFILKCQSKYVSNKKSLITEEDLNIIMTEVLNYSIIEGYYDTYHKLVAYKYKHNKTSKEIPVFFRPKSRDNVDHILKPIKKMENYAFETILRNYKVIDDKIKEIYNDKYSLYLNEDMKCIVNSFNLLIGLFMINGFIENKMIKRDN